MNNASQETPRFRVGDRVRFKSDKKHASPMRHLRDGDTGHVVATDPDDWMFVNFDGRNCWTLRSELEQAS